MRREPLDVPERFGLQVRDAGLLGRIGDLQHEFAAVRGLHMEVLVTLARQNLCFGHNAEITQRNGARLLVVRLRRSRDEQRVDTRVGRTGILISFLAFIGRY